MSSVDLGDHGVRGYTIIDTRRATCARGRSRSKGSAMVRLGDHVLVRGENQEAIVTAVHPDAQVEIRYLHVAPEGAHNKRYAAEALEKIEPGDSDD